MRDRPVGSAVLATPANTDMSSSPPGPDTPALLGCAGRCHPRRSAGCRPVSRLGTRCVPRWATRCTGRTCRSTSHHSRPGCPGRSGGRSRGSGAGRTSSPRRKLARYARCGGITALDRNIPRPHMKVLDAADATIGEVTSGTFSPTLKQGYRTGFDQHGGWRRAGRRDQAGRTRAAEAMSR